MFALVCGLLLLGTAGPLMAVDGGIPDSDMPTPSGGCSNAIGCHTTQSANAVIALEAVADDGQWSNPGEPGSLKVAVNIDSANSDADIVGIMLLDPDTMDNIRVSGWEIGSDPNQNDTAYNYNRMLSIVGDTQFVWAVNAPGSSGTYHLLARVHFDDAGARFNLSDTVEVAFVIGSPDEGHIRGSDDGTRLSSHPNPFSKTTTISYHQTVSGYTDLKVYDLSGRLIRILLAGEHPEGMYEVVWDGKDGHGRATPEGLYLYRLETADLVTTGKTVVLR
jgi:hypothetical protein